MVRGMFLLLLWLFQVLGVDLFVPQEMGTAAGPVFCSGYVRFYPE